MILFSSNNKTLSFQDGLPVHITHIYKQFGNLKKVVTLKIKALHPNNFFGFRVLNIFRCSNTAIQHLNKRLGVNNRYNSG
jgi:hypothetical protein